MLRYFIGILICCTICINSLCNAAQVEQNNYCSPADIPADDSGDAYYPATDWSSAFDWQVIKAVSLNNSRNVLLSPISLKIALALLYEGAGEATRREIQTALLLPLSNQEVRNHFEFVLRNLQVNHTKDYILNLHTRIFIDAAIQPRPQYNATAFNSYNTDIVPTYFQDPMNASQTINSWVEQATNGIVKELVTEADIADAVFVLANTVYFKGIWRNPFPRNLTTTRGFYVYPHQIIQVPYMTTSGQFYYTESSNLQAKILRLPYKGGKYAMFFMLPNSKGGLQDLLNNLNVLNIKRELLAMDLLEVVVSIPKFKFRFQSRMVQALKEMGIRHMFQNTASFPGIATKSSKRLVVSDFMQKSGIEVDEEGSLAYAVTDVQLSNKFGEADSFFNATHPFAFFVEDQTTGTILFIGKVVNPLESDPVPIPSRILDINSLPLPVVPLPETVTSEGS